MSDHSRSSWWEKCLAPRAVVLGIVVGFVGCCLAGYFVSRRNQFPVFHRFGYYTSAETLYYPTASQVRELARSRLDPNKIIVIIGGSSTLQGTGQRASELWSSKLEALLGDEYQVLNLALRGGRSAEIGAVAAEFLSREYPKLILVTDAQMASIDPAPDGLIYKYFFWDAYYKGLLDADPLRDQRLTELIEEGKQFERQAGRAAAKKNYCSPDGQQELRLGMALDRFTYHHDLWNMLALHGFHTIWTPPTGKSFSKPRLSYGEKEPEDGAPPRDFSLDCDYVLTVFRNLLKQDRVRQNDAGQWVENRAAPSWSTLDRAAVTCFPPAARDRTLVLLSQYNKYYVSHLNPQEQAGFAAIGRGTVEHLEKLGFTAQTFGRNFEADDWLDYTHLLPSGGEKLAAEVAPTVRAMAAKLGFIHGAEQPQIARKVP